MPAQQKSIKNIPGRPGYTVALHSWSREIWHLGRVYSHNLQKVKSWKQVWVPSCLLNSICILKFYLLFDDHLFIKKTAFKDFTWWGRRQGVAGGVGVDAALNGRSTNQLGGGHALSSLSLAQWKSPPQPSAPSVQHDLPCHFSQVKAWMLNVR